MCEKGVPVIKSAKDLTDIIGMQLNKLVIFTNFMNK